MEEEIFCVKYLNSKANERDEEKDETRRIGNKI
jgi:hypothetical protein